MLNTLTHRACQLLLSTAALAASTGALAQAPAATSINLAARVERNVVTYPGERSLHVSVPAAATYLGADRFILKEVSDCEMHVFVEADADRHVRRVYWVHFESNLPSQPDARMHYGDTDRKAQLWGGTVWVNTVPSLTSRTPRPGSDTEHFRNLIRDAGYTLPPAMATVRLVRLLDDPEGTGYGRKELMMIFGEDLAAHGLAYDQVTTEGKPNPRWTAIEKPLYNDAAKAFDVTQR